MMTMETLDCFGVGVARTEWDELQAWFFAAARKRDAKTLFFANAHALNISWYDDAFRGVLNRADLVLNDGLGVDFYATLAGTSFPGNWNGTDLFPRLFAEACADDPLRVFLYGARPGRAAIAAANLERRYPGVRVVGQVHGFHRDGVVDAINEANPDVVLVAMGNPVQEQWIDENRARLRAGVIAGVGALIDYFSEAIPRAPAMVRAARCEWLYRLVREPRRLFARYVVGNPVFLVRALFYLAHGQTVRLRCASG